MNATASIAEAALHLTESDVAELVDLNEAIEALETGLGREARGEAINIAKALGTFNGTASMHALGSVFPKDGYGGFKTWMNTGERGVALMEIFDVAHGRLAAIIEASVLGQLRTAAVSGLATKWLADPAADEMALIGTGRQAMMQLAAVAAVRKLRRVRIFSRTLENRRAFAAQARELFPFAVEEGASVGDTLAGAPIVTLVTRASSPFVSADMLAPGAHLNAVGAILPKHAEFEQDVFDSADAVVVDSIPGARANSKEFMDRYGKDEAAWARVETLGAVIASGKRRPTQPNLTLFKAMGMGISDLSVAMIALERARQRGIGKLIPAPVRASPRWWALV